MVFAAVYSMIMVGVGGCAGERVKLRPDFV